MAPGPGLESITDNVLRYYILFTHVNKPESSQVFRCCASEEGSFARCSVTELHGMLFSASTVGLPCGRSISNIDRRLSWIPFLFLYLPTHLSKLKFTSPKSHLGSFRLDDKGCVSVLISALDGRTRVLNKLYG